MEGRGRSTCLPPRFDNPGYGPGVEPLYGRGSVPNHAGGAHSAPQTLYSWWGGAFCSLHNNPIPDLGLRPRFSALRASFGSLPNSLHSPILRVCIKHCTGVLITTLYSEKFPSTPTGRKTPTPYPIVVSGLDISAECLPLYNSANRKNRFFRRTSGH